MRGAFPQIRAEATEGGCAGGALEEEVAGAGAHEEAARPLEEEEAAGDQGH